MFKMYISYMKKSFQNNLVYRFEAIVNILNTVVTIFVYIAIWTALFRLDKNVDGYSLKMVCTHFVISLGLNTIFHRMTEDVSWKVVSGEIANDLLRPIDHQLLCFSRIAGDTAFKVIFQFIPAFLVSFFVIGIYLPVSVLNAALFLVSIVSGFIIYFLVDYIVSIFSFWFHRVFFLMQIKGAIVAVLSGVFLPIWFLPEVLQKIVKYTPFESIYYTPISLYLGTISSVEIAGALVKQGLWIIILFALSKLVWKRGVRRLVVQGG